MGRAIEWFMSFTAIPTFRVISPQAQMTEDTESDQNGWGDDSSDESFGNENGASHNSDDLDDPNDEDVEMENLQQDQES